MGFKAYKVFMVVTFLGLVGCAKEKTKTVVETKIKYIDPFVPESYCDRGVDFAGSECDRLINDKTFWLAQKDVKVIIKPNKSNRPYFRLKKLRGKQEFTVKTHMVYEFMPSKNPAVVGDFRRGTYLEDPLTSQLLGYMEFGSVTRLSHNALDFSVESTTCDSHRDQASLNNQFTKYYTRGSEGQLWLGDHIPRNALEELLTFPFKMINFMTVGMIHSLLGSDKVIDLFREEQTLSHYYFSTELLPVNWGCSVQGEFILSPPELITLAPASK